MGMTCVERRHRHVRFSCLFARLRHDGSGQKPRLHIVCLTAIGCEAEAPGVTQRSREPHTAIYLPSPQSSRIMASWGLRSPRCPVPLLLILFLLSISCVDVSSASVPRLCAVVNYHSGTHPSRSSSHRFVLSSLSFFLSVNL